MRSVNLDMDTLRAFATLVDLGSLAQVGSRLGRTQSAISLQMKRLEEQAAVPIFRRDGRTLTLTESGDVLLSFARRILALNDEALASVKQSMVEGRLRFGTSQDFAEAWLPTILARFSATYPNVRFEVRVSGGIRVVAAVERGHLDLGLALGLGERPSAVAVGRLPLVWIAHKDFRVSLDEPVPLVVFNQPCRFRQKAQDALDEAGISWRVVYTSPSLSGIWAAVSAGLGLTIRTPEGLRPELAIMDRQSNSLPDLGDVDVSLYRRTGERSLASKALFGMLREHLAAHIANLRATKLPAPSFRM
jgi:DNA-binding transcriptional LysR family regulator